MAAANGSWALVGSSVVADEADCRASGESGGQATTSRAPRRTAS